MAIDHESRRRKIAELAIDVIAGEGLEAATIRRIAAEGRFSTTAITYYFRNKQDLLAWTFQVLSREGELRFEEELLRNPEDAIEALLTMVPWCPANLRRWKAYLAFWDQAARDPELASLLAQSTDTGLACIRRLLPRSLMMATDGEDFSRLLNALIQGFALQMLVDQQNWGKEKIRSTVQGAFDTALRRASVSLPACHPMERADSISAAYGPPITAASR